MKIEALTCSARLSNMRSCVTLLAIVVASSACASANTAGGPGAIANSGPSTARGAIMAARVGGTTGAAIARQMDQQAKDLALQIPGSAVERIGEGIQITFSSVMLFDSNSDVVRPQALANMRALATSLKRYSNTNLLIVGHTDSVGTATFNQDLSLRRANSASRYLASQAVSQSRIRTSGRGELEPLATNGTDAGRQKNRRIEIAIFAR